MTLPGTPGEHKRDVIGGICASMASFIAAIDSDSRDVAAYIKQRLGAALEHVPIDELEEVGQDARQLTATAAQRDSEQIVCGAKLGQGPCDNATRTNRQGEE